MRKLVLFAALLATGTSGCRAGVGVRPAEDKPNPLAGAIDTIMTRLYRAKDGVYVGIPNAKVLALLKGRAYMVGDLYLPLADSQYAPGARWHGSLRVQTDDTKKLVTDIELTLITGPYDLKAAEAAVVAVGKKLGLWLESDKEDPHTFFDARKLRKEIWIALGKGIIVFEVSVP